MHRVLFAIHRKPELSSEEFLTHYRDVHVPIARKLPKLRQYDIFPVQTGPDSDGDTPDAFTLMTFDSADDFETFLTAPEMAEIAKDNETFIGRVTSYTIDHIPVIAG
jgi:uncharacterized protein (TIGR02118 family)